MRTAVHPAWDILPLMDPKRRVNAKTLLVYFPHSLLSRVLECLLAHAMVAQLHSHKSAALSNPILIHGILARALAQEAVEVQCIGRASQSSIELDLGHMPSAPPATGAVLLGDTSDVDGSRGALSNPESHTFGLPVVGSASSLLPRRAGVRARTLESDPGRSSVSVSS